jgi:colanic acid biosynthesis protein WcaH
MTDDQGSLAHAVCRLKSFVENPSEGLPEEVFQFISGITPLVNVDLLITDPKAGVLLTWRPTGNYPAGWHLPGGIIRLRETFEERIRKVALNELSVDVASIVGPIEINQMIHPDATTRVHFISFLFKVQIRGELDEASQWRAGDPVSGQWHWHPEWPENMYGAQSIYTKLQIDTD